MKRNHPSEQLDVLNDFTHITVELRTIIIGLPIILRICSKYPIVQTVVGLNFGEFTKFYPTEFQIY